jgi:hypothetical protein
MVMSSSVSDAPPAAYANRNGKDDDDRFFKHLAESRIVLFCEPRKERQRAVLDDDGEKIEHLDDPHGGGIDADLAGGAHPAED